MSNSWWTEDGANVINSTLEPHNNGSMDISPCDFNYIPTVYEYDEALGNYHTAMLVVGGVATLLLYALFLEQVVFTRRNASKVYRRHINWITSVYPFMTLMSVISVVVPRADHICTAVKVTYMSIGISHFTDLTTLMFGNEKVMLARLSETQFNLKVGPACWCCLCFPSPLVTRRLLRVVRWLLWQMPYTQAIYFIMSILLITANTDRRGQLNPNASYLWLNILNFFSFLGGVYALQILAFVCRGHLDHYRYNKKSFSVKTLVLVTKLQSFILDILYLYDVFPCSSFFITPRVFKLTVENTIYLMEMLILGPFAYWQYHSLEFLDTSLTDEGDRRQTKDQSISTVSKLSEAEGYTEARKHHPKSQIGDPAHTWRSNVLTPRGEEEEKEEDVVVQPYHTTIGPQVRPREEASLGSCDHEGRHSVFLDLSLVVSQEPDSSYCRSRPAEGNSA
ncbi:organic solute transporter alpha-like protein [Panulirus ornatus]|uniref:organic solute transporter alpha-like protein n=1 Tax=Panulirus ornatus TaxID=150431 RepID=UPI003A8A7327